MFSHFFVNSEVTGLLISCNLILHTIGMLQ